MRGFASVSIRLSAVSLTLSKFSYRAAPAFKPWTPATHQLWYASTTRDDIHIFIASITRLCALSPNLRLPYELFEHILKHATYFCRECVFTCVSYPAEDSNFNILVLQKCA
jgi:hypothetical protein